MSYSTPAPPSGLGGITYTIWATHTNGIEVKIEMGSMVGTESDADAAIQAALDLIDGSPAFTFTSASKGMTYSSTITPTP